MENNIKFSYHNLGPVGSSYVGIEYNNEMKIKARQDKNKISFTHNHQNIYCVILSCLYHGSNNDIRLYIIIKWS